MSKCETIRIDNNMDEPIQIFNHPLILEDGVQSPQCCCCADPLSRMNTSIDPNRWFVSTSASTYLCNLEISTFPRLANNLRFYILNVSITCDSLILKDLQQSVRRPRHSHDVHRP